MATVLHDVVRVEREGASAVITIAHPPANAISQAVMAGLSEALLGAEADPTCRAVIITGDGPKFFAAGADISEFASLGGEAIARGQALTLQIEASPLPVIAAVNGIALGGGCEITLACDMRLASRNARFGQPEINLGIIPGWGGTQRLPRLIGRAAAMRLLLSGEHVGAEEALRLGIVEDVVAPEALLGLAHARAAKFAATAPLALAATKRAVVQGLDQSLTDGLKVEEREFLGVFRSEDAIEGATAFFQKRPPEWHGR